MADEEPKPAIGSDLQQEIASFNKGKLHPAATEEKQSLPDAATIEAEKKAAKEESGQ